MTDRPPLDREPRVANLAIDPDVLARELEAEEVGDPLDELDLDDPEQDALEAIRQCDEALNWLQQGHDQQLQGLRVFCEHRDPRSVPLLLPLLDEVCPVVRMSAVYALGRNPSPPCCGAPFEIAARRQQCLCAQSHGLEPWELSRCTSAESLDSCPADRCGCGAVVGIGVFGGSWSDLCCKSRSGGWPAAD